MSNVVAEFESTVKAAPVAQECAQWELKTVGAGIPVFDRRSMAEARGGALFVDYAEQVGRATTFRHYFRYDKKTACDVLALYKGKTYQIKTFWCGLAEQACVILD